MNFLDKQVNEGCNTIADHYGQAVEMHKSLEEMAELTKVLATGYTKQGNTVKQNLDIKAMTQEIADVLICLHHLQHLFFIEDEVNKIIKNKIARQLKRMQKEIKRQKDATTLF